MPKLDLEFLYSTDRVGFTSTKVMSFRETAPSAIVRELTQNALDASRAAENKKAIIRFCLRTVKTNDIPGIDSYKDALKKAKKYWVEKNNGCLSSQEQLIVDYMEIALKKQHLPVLAIIDNGIGLTESSMADLLGDGISTKLGEAGGAYGNGHFVSFPASDLRYLLYGAVNGSKWVVSGHAILASYPKHSENGYLISGTTEDDEHCYLTRKGDVPQFFKPTLNDIQKNYHHGSAIFIPAFNNFRNENKNLTDIIVEAVVCNFFPAIERDELNIIIENEETKSKTQTINSSNLEKTLHDFEGNKRNKHFLSGHKANMAYKAIKEGNLHRVNVLDGQVGVYLQAPSFNERTHINLFRNDMWITNSDKSSSGGLAGFTATLSGHEIFESVVLVTAKNAPRFHNLIRLAEPPLHNLIDAQSLRDRKAEQKELRTGFETLRKWFGEIVSEISQEGFISPNIFAIQPGSNEVEPGWHYGNSINVMGQSSLFQTRGRKKSRSPLNPHEKVTPRSTSSKRRYLPNNFKVTAISVNETNEQSAKRICVHSFGDWEDMLLRLVVDESTDSTTDDNVWQPYEVQIHSAQKIISSKSTKKFEELEIIESPSAIRIGDLKNNQEIVVHVNYTINQIDGLSQCNPSLRVKLEPGALDSENSQ